MQALEVHLGEGRTIIKTHLRDNGEVGIIIRKLGEPHRVGDFPAPGEPGYAVPGERRGPEDDEIWINISQMEAGVVLLDAVVACLRDLCKFPESPKDR